MPRMMLSLPPTCWIAILASTALLNLAYPPFHLAAPPFVCLVPLILPMLDPDTPMRHAVLGFWFGLISNAVLFHWMAVAIWRFKPSAIWAFLFVVLAFGLYTGAAFGLVAWIRIRTRIPMIVAFPTTWTALESIAGHHGPLALPWLGLGNSLTAFPPLIQVADIVGVRGITFLLCIVNVAVALAWRDRHAARRASAWLGTAAGVLSLLLAYGELRPQTIRVRPAGTITIVQPNLGALEKWDPALQDSLVRTTLALSNQSAREHSPDLVVWPELALPAPLSHHPEWTSALERHTEDLRAPVLTGAVDVVAQPDGSTLTYNAAHLFSSRTQPRQAPYRKERLVLLFERWNGTSPGRDNDLVETPVGRLGVLICHEATFERLARVRRRAGADLLVNLANDVWFHGTTAPSQHAAHLVMRAIETRTGVVRAGNSGPSGFVDPLGRSHGWTDENVATASTAQVSTSDVMTLYVRWGDWVGALSVVGLAGLVVVSIARRVRPS